MITKYSASEGIWEWDSYMGKWNRPPFKREQKKPTEKYVVEVKKKKNLLVEWANWNEYLLALFKSARGSENWNFFLSAHDVSDNRFFSILEFHYKSGKLKLEE